jgi:RND superfamily putative drug exporter
MHSFNVSTQSLARVSARRPWRTIGIWLILLVLAGFAATGLSGALSTQSTLTNNPESVQADNLLKDRLRGGHDRPVQETVLVRSTTGTVDDPAFRQFVEATTADLRGLTGVVAGASNYYEAAGAGAPAANQLVSTDRHATIIPVTLAGTLDEAMDHKDAYLGLIDARNGHGFQVLATGGVSTNDAFHSTAEKDLKKGESIGILTALVVLVIVFGALVAAGVPLALGLVAIVVAVGATALVGKVMDLSFFITNVITMIGLAVGIDYALFIIERYREERRRGADKLAAIEIAGSTASKAVLFSGITVMLALGGMIVLPDSTFRSIGIGTVFVVAAAVFAMLTLVPALLSLLGDTINWPRGRRGGVTDRRTDGQTPNTSRLASSGFWARVTHIVMARPVVSALIATAILVVATVPYFDLKRGESGIEALPDSDAKTAYLVISRDFVAHKPSPVEIVIDGQQTDPAVQTGIGNFVAAVAQDTAFGPAAAPVWNTTGDLALIEVPLATDDSNAQNAAIERLRDETIPVSFGNAATVKVGGEAALNVDFNAAVDTYTPLVFAFVLGLSFILLMVAFRSIVVPLKAIVMNLLSVGAAYGLLVVVFQKGYGADFFGFTKTPTIEAFLPIFLFCILFGLSMDYHVFLLSRIKEHYDQTKRNSESVAAGLQSTARIIAGAALIMVAVFAGFASGHLVQLQQMGFGLAVAVFLDATVVRSVLVPATMALLGDRNWYLPRWLGWLPRLDIEGAAHPAPAPVPVVAPQAVPVLVTSVSGDD